MTRRPSHRLAFTLIELLVVITIIAILVGIVAAVGMRTVRTQEERATRNVLMTLDRALDEFVTASGAIPKYVPDGYNRVPGPDNDMSGSSFGGVSNWVEFPSGSGVRHPLRPDAAVFLRQIQGRGQADAIIRAIPETFLQSTVIDNGSQLIDRDGTPSVVDPWGITQEKWSGLSSSQTVAQNQQFKVASQQVVYYVHPNNDAAQAVFGKCVNGRPYFVSAGPDRHYGLPEEGDDTAAVLKMSPTQGESQADFRQRVLRATRENNIYSYSVDTTFDVDIELLGRWDSGSSGGGPNEQ